MKKIAGILICIALAFSFAGCSWQIPQKVSVKTNADYNFSLGNFEKDFSEQLNISKIMGDVKLPNNGKVYDYWPNKQGDTQAFLMYMPLQEIPIDIGSYFDKGSLADSIKNISFEKEIEVPEVSFSFPVEFNLDDVNKEINKQFVLAGLIQNYSPSQFGAILKQVADSITYEKGVLVVTAYEVSLEDIAKLNAGTATIQSIANNIATSYYGSVSITSGNQASLSGYFNNGKAELVIPSSGFDFISDDININFSNIPDSSDYNYQPLVFIAKIDTDREYQIKKVSGIGNTISIPSVSFNQKIDSLAALKDSGVEECKIGEGSIDLDFDIPSEWKNVAITYDITMTGGIEVTSKSVTVTSGNSNNVGSIDLSGKSIKAEEINVNAAVGLTVAGATIDFTKPPAISFDSNISRIETVTVKLSETSLDISESQPLPDVVLDMLKRITINECGIKGTYTNTLPAGNEINLIVSSDFFGLSQQEQSIDGDKVDERFELLTGDTERTIKLAKNPVAANGEFNAFDFKVKVELPGGDSNKVTVSNVEPGKTYKLAVKVEPVINWTSVTIDTSNIDLPTNDKIGTGFDPSTIRSSIDDALGEGFSDNIEIPDCNLYLYITKPEIDAFENLKFTGSEISMYYGDADKNKLDGTESIEILKSTDTIKFASEAPTFDISKGEDGSETVTSRLKTGDQDCTLKVGLSKLLTSLPTSVSGEKQLCVDYNIKLSNENADDGTGELTIVNNSSTDELLASSGSIGIYAVIELPLRFALETDTAIDLKKLMNKDSNEDQNEDLFGRKDATGFGEAQKYLDVIDSARINYKPVAFPIQSTDDITIELCMGNDTDFVKKTLPLDTDDGDNIEITTEEMQKLLNVYPLQLKTAKILFPDTNNDNQKTEISIQRQKKIDVNLQIGITTDGTIELFGGKK